MTVPETNLAEPQPRHRADRRPRGRRHLRPGADRPRLRLGRPRLRRPRRPAPRSATRRVLVALCPSAASWPAADADLVISAVTAEQHARRRAERGRRDAPGCVFLDINSASPRTKAECGDIIAGAGGRYVEAAVMTLVPPYGIKVPMLLGCGSRCCGARRRHLPISGLLASRWRARNWASGVAIKTCRSVIIKGMEAIVIESFVTARRYGVERKAVLASLAETFPGMDWERNGDYFFSRVIQHGKRRAEEMREAAATVREAGLVPFMASAIADRHNGWPISPGPRRSPARPRTRRGAPGRPHPAGRPGIATGVVPAKTATRRRFGVTLCAQMQAARVPACAGTKPTLLRKSEQRVGVSHNTCRRAVSSGSTRDVLQQRRRSPCGRSRAGTANPTPTGSAAACMRRAARRGMAAHRGKDRIPA